MFCVLYSLCTNLEHFYIPDDVFRITVFGTPMVEMFRIMCYHVLIYKVPCRKIDERRNLSVRDK